MASLKMRVAASVLSLSATGLISIALSEYYEPTAKPPLPGDVATGGYGSTTNENGKPLKLGEKVSPTRALVLLQKDAGRIEHGLKKCLGTVALYQHEWDAYMELAYNVGEWAVCDSTIKPKLQAGQYQAACRTILDFNKFRDTSKPKVWNARKQRFEHPLVEQRGLSNRRQREAAKCLGHEP